MKRTLLFLLAMAAALPAWATAQAPEVLKFEGNTYSINTNPLEPWLAAHPRALPKSEVISSGLWRGYIGTWAIRDGTLFLEDVRILTSDDRDRSVMKEMFPGGAPQPAAWFTGNLIVPTGKLVKYVHMGYGSTYASYMIATVSKGTVRQIRTMNANEFEAFRRAQFEAFKKTPEYRKHLETVRKGESKTSDDFDEQFLFQFASEEYLSRIFPEP